MIIKTGTSQKVVPNISDIPPTIKPPTLSRDVIVEREGANPAVSASPPIAGSSSNITITADDVVEEMDVRTRDAIVAKNMVLSKIAYFIFYGSFSSCFPFYGLYLHTRGFGTTIIGLICAINPVATVLLLPPLAYLADKRHWNTPILIAGVLIGGISLWLGAVFSRDVFDPSSRMLEDGGNEITATTTHAPRPMMSLNGTGLEEDEGETVYAPNSPKIMILVAITVALQALFSVPVPPFIDHHTMAVIPAEKKKEWGATRVFGAYGWGIMAPIFSLVADYYGYGLSFTCYTIGSLAGCGALIKSRIVRPEPTEMRFIEVLKFLANPAQRRVVTLLIASAAMGMGMAIISTYLFIFLKADLNASQFLLGISISVTVVVEIPIFNYSRWIHDRFSNRQLMGAAMAGWAFRVVLYSLIGNPWIILVIEPIHGFTYGTAWLAGINTVSTAFPHDLAASAIGTLHASMFGVGTTMGMIFGGIGYESLGPRVFFRICAGVMACLAGLFVLVDKYFEKEIAFRQAKVDAASTLEIEAVAKSTAKGEEEYENRTLRALQNERDDTEAMEMRAHTAAGNGLSDESPSNSGLYNNEQLAADRMLSSEAGMLDESLGQAIESEGNSLKRFFTSPMRRSSSLGDLSHQHSPQAKSTSALRNIIRRSSGGVSQQQHEGPHFEPHRRVRSMIEGHIPHFLTTETLAVGGPLGDHHQCLSTGHTQALNTSSCSHTSTPSHHHGRDNSYTRSGWTPSFPVNKTDPIEGEAQVSNVRLSLVED